jgi:hypothetical protein
LSFNVVIKQSFSDPICVTKELNTVLTCTGSLKENCSIIDPVILLAADLTDIPFANYCSIEEFGRDYFINDIVSVKPNLVEIHCHVDVLCSFRAGIKQNSAIIRRQETEWNLYINDGSFRVYQNPMILTKEFPSGFTTQEFVLSVAGG